MGIAERELASAMDAIAADSRMSAGIAAMASRRSEFADTRAAMLAGIGVVPEARTALSERLDAFWSYSSASNGGLPDQNRIGELVIGSGIHAAIYCATRVRNGNPRPLVLERSNRVGGTFAMSSVPTFYLNSGNRPGLVGLPNNGQALNVIPGAPVQPSDIGMSEYQTNVDLSFAIRATLALYANVVQDVTVTAIDQTDRTFADYPIRVDLDTGRSFYAARVIDARGLGDANTLTDSSDRVMTFPQYAATFDTDPFPMRGMRRVAVVGGGDSGKVAVESLLGIGPSSGMSTARLDYVERIDWYGQSVSATCEQWLRDQRKRYARIGSYLGTGRLNVRNETANVIPSVDSALVNGQSYDKVITATGYTLPTLGLSDYLESYRLGGSDFGLAVARKSYETDCYVVGPAANLAFTQREVEEGIARRQENKVAIFRYAPRTAALATYLPATARPDEI